MRLISILVVIFILLKMFNLQKEIKRSDNHDLILLAKGFVKVKQFLNEIANERLKENQRVKANLMKLQEEEKRRKIINENLMPLTKGNSFMKDFYTGRY